MTSLSHLAPSHEKVLAVLVATAKPMSAYDILDRLHRHGVRSPPTVYRALEQLTRRGRVHRLESLNAFVACRHQDGAEADHPHGGCFAICDGCGAVQEMDDAPLAKAARKAGASFLVRTDRCVVELSGLCRACGES